MTGGQGSGGLGPFNSPLPPRVRISPLPIGP